MSVVFDTLSYMSELDSINLWVYKKLKPYLGKRILEAGCGNGNLTYYLQDRELIIALDNDDKMLNEFKVRFSRNHNLRVVKCDLEDPAVEGLVKYNIDTIICINTLEHLQNDLATLNNFNTILKEGNLILLVPTFQVLYSTLDKAAGHYRRYNLKAITDKVEKCNFIVTKKMYSNFFGILGWFLNGKILKKERLSRRLLWLFNFLMPILAIVEKWIGPPIGLSLTLICRKK